MTALTLTGVGHAFFGRTVLSRVSLSIRRGEVVALVGPSGCGKSTLAHIAAGLISAREGRVANHYRRHAMVFQDPRLLPWRGAAGNIAYPLELSGMSRRERDLRVRQSARMVQLEDQDLDKFPVELSGGMRQRVAIARALAIEPDFVFFDEPFTALDVALKRRMQDLVIAAAQHNRFAALFITHDLMEAIRVAHRILVMHHKGHGLVGERIVDGEPGNRDDASIFASMQAFLRSDIAFAHIHDVDERRRT
ncbi:MAG: ATP-binding cassette domain-containing protein [Devosia indica]